MDRETILSKIKKLIALSDNNPSQEESYSALMKAQAMMAQYKIDEGEIKPEEVERCTSIVTEFKYSTGSSDTYLINLSKILAENFCCVTYSSACKGSKTKYISFMGLSKDLDVVTEAMNIADRAIRKGYDIVWKDLCKEYDLSYIPAKLFNPYKVGYIKGYLAGLKDVLDQQRSQMQEWGLVLVAPQEARDAIDSMKTVTTRQQIANKRFYDRGYQDGKSFNMNKRVSCMA